ncbi:MAG: GNAT family N-acetyltransferase [Clostridium sp.]|uniref:GNAT family N-acetyltransferase n=1 Tax=Clostridium sp. TaxID=1506 RepID=UPI003D6C6FCB
MEHNNHSIIIKMKLNEEDYKAIKNLETICYGEKKTDLKLELDFKKHQTKVITIDCVKDKRMTEFLYYENEILTGYLGLSNFGGYTVEITGMVHPKFRRKRIFQKLYLIAKEEWEKEFPQEVLGLCDHTSISGLAFINSNALEYVSSEYKMCLNKKILNAKYKYVISLRLATSEDASEIDRQTSVYFGQPQKEDKDKGDAERIETNDQIEKPVIQDDDNFISYMAEIDGKIIGKIHISIVGNEGFIYGFGVLPKYRENGYGREILKSTLDNLKKRDVENIFLDVATENKSALALYESCGFEEISVMDYYIIS